MLWWYPEPVLISVLALPVLWYILFHFSMNAWLRLIILLLVAITFILSSTYSIIYENFTSDCNAQSSNFFDGILYSSFLTIFCILLMIWHDHLTPFLEKEKKKIMLSSNRNFLYKIRHLLIWWLQNMFDRCHRQRWKMNAFSL